MTPQTFTQIPSEFGFASQNSINSDYTETFGFPNSLRELRIIAYIMFNFPYGKTKKFGT